jgi:3-oxoacyl-[acyl-carrier-protein] synthase II
VRTITKVDATGLATPFGGEIVGFDPKQYVKPRKSLKVMSVEIQWAFAAADMAMAHAGLSGAGSVGPERLGVIFGCDMIYSDVNELLPAYRKCLVDGQFDYQLWGQQALGEMFPLWMLKTLPNMPACHIGIAHDARGPTNCITLGEVSSLLAFIEAMRVIERGHADVVITGGAGTRLHLAPLAYRGGLLLSRRCDAPEQASRPFDAARDGMVNGEGAAAIVLESRAHAQRRKARILARAIGASSRFEPRRNGAPAQGIGVTNAIRAALESAHLQPGQIGHVNAHGLSTIEHDRAEAHAIRDTLGDVPVTAPKSFFGNLGSGTGAVELVVSILALEKGEIPVTLNYEQPDPACPLNVICGEPAQSTIPTALVLNQATMGQAAAVVISADAIE